MTFFVPLLQKFLETSSTLEHGIYYSNLNLCSGSWWLKLVLSHGNLYLAPERSIPSPFWNVSCALVSALLSILNCILFYILVIFIDLYIFFCSHPSSPLPSSTLLKEWGKLYFKYKWLLNSEIRLLGGVIFLMTSLLFYTLWKVYAFTAKLGCSDHYIIIYFSFFLVWPLFSTPVILLFHTCVN